MTQNQRKSRTRLTTIRVTMVGEPREAECRDWDIARSTGIRLMKNQSLMLPTLEYRIDVPDSKVGATVRVLMSTGHVARCAVEPVTQSAPSAPATRSRRPRTNTTAAATEKLVTIQICMKEETLVQTYGNPEGNAYDLEAKFGIKLWADGPERPPTVYYTTEVPESQVQATIANIQSMPYVHGAFVKPATVAQTSPTQPQPQSAPAQTQSGSSLETVYIVANGIYPGGAQYTLEQTFDLKLRPATGMAHFTTEVPRSQVPALLRKLSVNALVRLAYTGAAPASLPPEEKLVPIYITVSALGHPEGCAWEIDKEFGLYLRANGPERPPSPDFIANVPASKVAELLPRLLASQYVKSAVAGTA